jgi:hypothetical protein
MSNKKISELDELLTTPEPTDEFAVVSGGQTKKVTYERMMSGAGSGASGLPAGTEYLVCPAGSIAPDGEYYYNIITSAPVPILQGELIGEAITSFDMIITSKNRVEHSLHIPVPGWHESLTGTQQINDTVFLDSVLKIAACTEDGKLLKSVNGGVSWSVCHQASVPIKKLLMIQEADRNAGTTALILYAVGGTILFRSVDSGDQWIEHDASTYLASGEIFVDIKSSGSGSASGKTSMSIPYLLSSIGGIYTFDQNFDPYVFVQRFLLPLGNDYNAFSIANDLLGTSIFNVIANYYDGTIYTGKVFRGDTTNGISEVHSVQNKKFSAILFLNADSGIIVGEALDSGTPVGYIILTTDACLSWQSPDLTTLNPVPAPLRDIAISDEYIWVAGHDSNILRCTKTDPMTWNRVSTFINDIGSGRALINIAAYKSLINVTGDEGGSGIYYYYIPDVYDGVTYQFIPVDTLWIKIPQQGGGFKEGFVCALNV